RGVLGYRLQGELVGHLVAHGVGDVEVLLHGASPWCWPGVTARSSVAAPGGGVLEDPALHGRAALGQGVVTSVESGAHGAVHRLVVLEVFARAAVGQQVAQGADVGQLLFVLGGALGEFVEVDGDQVRVFAVVHHRVIAQ